MTSLKRRLFNISEKMELKKFYYLSDIKHRGLHTTNKIIQPCMFKGAGTIEIKNCTIGVKKSPYFFHAYSYIEARKPTSIIRFMENSIFNNNLTVISEGGGIYIGSNCLFGTNVFICDSDFHNLGIAARHRDAPETKEVHIGNNVFLGNDVKILKSVTIGDNTVIGMGSVVTKDIPANYIAAGNPAKLIREIES